MKLTSKKTARGFALIEFEDAYQNKCSVQKSSLATDDAIWLGIDDPKPSVRASQAAQFGVEVPPSAIDPQLGIPVGWVPYPIPAEVNLWTRMHLTRAQVKKLLPVLEHFVKTGDLP